MIIPVRCTSCGKAIANKWLAYQKAVKDLEAEGLQDKKDTSDDLVENFEKSMKGAILDQLGLDRMCCRRHLLTHIDLIDII